MGNSVFLILGIFAGVISGLWLGQATVFSKLSSHIIGKDNMGIEDDKN